MWTCRLLSLPPSWSNFHFLKLRSLHPLTHWELIQRRQMSYWCFEYTESSSCVTRELGHRNPYKLLYGWKVCSLIRHLFSSISWIPIGRSPVACISRYVYQYHLPSTYHLIYLSLQQANLLVCIRGEVRHLWFQTNFLSTNTHLFSKIHFLYEAFNC